MPAAFRPLVGRILIVDDEPSILDVCRRFLTGRGFDVDVLQDGRKAFDRILALSGGYDMVLTDVRMPGMDGLELNSHLKRRFPKIDVIVLTGAPELEGAVAALKAGAYDYLTKPVDLDVLATCVNRCWEKRQIADALNAEKSLRAELEAAYRELRRAEGVKEAILARVGHELRTPLTVVRGMLSVARLETDPKRHGDRLDSIEAAAHRLGAVINDLLLFAELARGEVALRKAPVDIGALARSAAELCAGVCREKALTVELDLPSAGPILEGDPDQLLTAFKHLVLNAALFNRPQGIVRVRCAEEAGMAHVWVSDAGEGIDPAVLPKIFEDFWQAADFMTRKVGGLGLGLAIVKGIVEAHRGSITVESSSAGSTFHVFLPMKAV